MGQAESSPYEPQKKKSNLSKKKKGLQDLRTRIMRELLESEHSYLKTLKELDMEWEQPLTESKEKGKKILGKKIQVIFCNITDLRLLHQRLLDALQRRFQDWDETTRIGDILVLNSRALQLYSEYINNFPRSMDCLEKSLKKKSFIKFASKRTTKPIGMYLTSKLIQPILRIPSYSLLLNDLFNNTWVKHVDYLSLKSTKDHFNEVATCINKYIYLYEGYSKFLALQHLIGKDYKVFSDKRILIEEGNINYHKEEEEKKTKDREGDGEELDDLEGEGENNSVIDATYTLSSDKLFIWYIPETTTTHSKKNSNQQRHDAQMLVYVDLNDLTIAIKNEKIYLIYRNKIHELSDKKNNSEWVDKVSKAKQNYNRKLCCRSRLVPVSV
eukprot:TRINITY_DN1255_c2_g1_i5.p1 TRINITY_DN1255_c2_g1~~TRINITY_DN1255_c2_g1_i5.p1  ORF type:complete len:384 (+),score=43.77 TRINITY_DN1255_c2_g1_i5:16-1167(+)